MSHYIAIVEEVGPDKAVGVWFPDLPGCFTAGDTLEEALANAPEAIGLYAEALGEKGQSLPAARRLSTLRSDPNFVSELRGNMVALVAFSLLMPSAAE